MMKIKCTILHQDKRGPHLLTERAAAAAAVCAMKSDSLISDLLLSVHLNDCRPADSTVTSPPPFKKKLNLGTHSLTAQSL